MTVRFNPIPSMPFFVDSENYLKGWHKIKPFVISGDPKDSWQQLKDILANMELTEFISATDNYIHVVCQSKVFGFTDDVNFSLRAKEKIIHVRSEARICMFWDFGVNRARLEKIRSQFQKTTSGVKTPVDDS